MGQLSFSVSGNCSHSALEEQEIVGHEAIPLQQSGQNGVSVKDTLSILWATERKRGVEGDEVRSILNMLSTKDSVCEDS